MPAMDSTRARLSAYLLQETARCVRQPQGRFRHQWLAPMPYRAPAPDADRGEPFRIGDYSLGLFHHDAGESSIELLKHEAFREAVAGSLLCLLDNASPDGCIHRIELAHKVRDPEPAKPIMAQFSLRCAVALGAEWAARHRVLERAAAFVRYRRLHCTGRYGLPLTTSARASGFDNDLLSAGYPDGTVEGPDTAALMVLEHRALAELAGLLSDDAEAAIQREQGAELADRIERLLYYEDDDGAFYTALRYRRGSGAPGEDIVGHRDPDGRFVPLESWTTLLPLYAGIPSADRAERLIRRLLDPARYWGPYGVRTVPASSPYYSQAPRVMLFDHARNGPGPVSNWGGPIWILSNYYLARGLANYGRPAEAKALAEKTATLLACDLDATESLHECYDDSGRGLWPQRGTFISWNVLALSMLGDLG